MKPWFPFWIDSWLFGSTRHELIVKGEKGEMIDLRGIFLDLISLSKKHNGFIRANEITPYPHVQLAGMFCVSIERLEQCINICLKPEIGKLKDVGDGIYYVVKHKEYTLNTDYARRLENAGRVEETSPIDTTKPPEPTSKERLSAIQNFIGTSLPNVSSMKNQLTKEQGDKLIAKYGSVLVREILEAMENKTDLRKKYISVYLTANDWCKRQASDKKQAIVPLVQKDKCDRCKKSFSTAEYYNERKHACMKSEPISEETKAMLKAATDKMKS